MSDLVKRVEFTIKLCQWDNGEWFADVFPTEGDFAGVAVVSTGEHATRYQVMLDLAERMYGDEQVPTVPV